MSQDSMMMGRGHLMMHGGEELFSDGNVPIIRNTDIPTYDSSNRTEKESSTFVSFKKSSRVSKLLEKLNDYVLDDKVRYGLNIYANHTKFSANNCCFISNLNKSDEPNCYNEAVKDVNWTLSQWNQKLIEALDEAGDNVDEISKLCLNQRKYCIELLHEYGLLACKSVATPLPKNVVLAHKKSDDDKFL
ncbi:hypothetical protein Tco_0972712 [Tanacetum coccineum]